MTIDSNIIIAYLTGEEAVVEILSDWRKQGGVMYLPTVVETEILCFDKWTEQERLLTEQFLEENFITISFDRQVARIAAQVRRETKLKFPDAAIAASALYTHTSLLTRNKKDFRRCKDIRLITI